MSSLTNLEQIQVSNTNQFSKLYQRLRKLSAHETHLFFKMFNIDDEKLTDHNAFINWLQTEKKFLELLVEMFNGAHIVFYDDGELYQSLCEKFPNVVRKRRSSHESLDQSYAFFGKGINECLFATRKLTSKEKKNHPGVELATWIQLEKNTTASWLGMIMHIIDYILYKICGKNIGPLGYSAHNDQNPIRFDEFMEIRKPQDAETCLDESFLPKAGETDNFSSLRAG